jgi:hypothetical protein
MCCHNAQKYRGAASKDELFLDHVPLLGSILPSGVFGATWGLTRNKVETRMFRRTIVFG